MTTLLKDDDIIRVNDSGKAKAVLKILKGQQTITSFLVNVVTPSFTGIDSEKAEISHLLFNGSPGIVIWSNKNPVLAFNFEIKDNLIKKVHVRRNPDKLKFFQKPDIHKKH